MKQRKIFKTLKIRRKNIQLKFWKRNVKVHQEKSDENDSDGDSDDDDDEFEDDDEDEKRRAAEWVPRDEDHAVLTAAFTDVLMHLHHFHEERGDRERRESVMVDNMRRRQSTGFGVEPTALSVSTTANSNSFFPSTTPVAPVPAKWQQPLLQRQQSESNSSKDSDDSCISAAPKGNGCCIS